MIGALTMSRIVTDPELSAEILQAAEKSLSKTGEAYAWISA